MQVRCRCLFEWTASNPLSLRHMSHLRALSNCALVPREIPQQQNRYQVLILFVCQTGSRTYVDDGLIVQIVAPNRVLLRNAEMTLTSVSLLFETLRRAFDGRWRQHYPEGSRAIGHLCSSSLNVSMKAPAARAVYRAKIARCSAVRRVASGRARKYGKETPNV